MENEIFREKSLNKMKSPENLDDYIKVTNFNLWMLLGAIIILICGFLIWSTFGNIYLKTKVSASVIDKKITCQCDWSILDEIVHQLKHEEKIKVEMNGKEGIITICDIDNLTASGYIDIEDCAGLAFIRQEISPISLLFE